MRPSHPSPKNCFCAPRNSSDGNRHLHNALCAGQAINSMWPICLSVSLSVCPSVRVCMYVRMNVHVHSCATVYTSNPASCKKSRTFSRLPGWRRRGRRASLLSEGHSKTCHLTAKESNFCFTTFIAMTKYCPLHDQSCYHPVFLLTPRSTPPLHSNHHSSQHTNKHDNPKDS